jgi:hypothetical protein
MSGDSFIEDDMLSPDPLPDIKCAADLDDACASS